MSPRFFVFSFETFLLSIVKKTCPILHTFLRFEFRSFDAHVQVCIEIQGGKARAGLEAAKKRKQGLNMKNIKRKERDNQIIT